MSDDEKNKDDVSEEKVDEDTLFTLLNSGQVARELSDDSDSGYESGPYGVGCDLLAWLNGHRLGIGGNTRAKRWSRWQKIWKEENRGRAVDRAALAEFRELWEHKKNLYGRGTVGTKQRAD